MSLVGDSHRAKVAYVLSTGTDKVFDEKLKRSIVCSKAFGSVFDISRKQMALLLRKWKQPQLV